MRAAKCRANRCPGPNYSSAHSLNSRTIILRGRTPGRCRAETRSESAKSEAFITFQEVQEAAANRGLCITIKELGPFYTISCHEGSPNGSVLAVTSGFIVPIFGLMHCDMLQVFTKGMRGAAGERIRGGVLGLGLLVGGAVFSYGWAAGCKKAEILAIDDDVSWHERLVKYYSYFGFKPVVKVEGDKLSDLPHMLVWGGAGTRLDADVAAMLAKWTPSLRRQAREGPKKAGAVSDQDTEAENKQPAA